MKFPFETGFYDLESAHATPCPMEPNLSAAEPLLSMLRLQYLYCLHQDAITFCQNREDLGTRLQIPEDQLVTLRCLNLRQSLSDCFSRLTSAGSHQSVAETLQHVSVLVHTVHCMVMGGEEGKGTRFPKSIGSLWKTVVER